MMTFFQLIAQAPAATGAVVDLTTRKGEISALNSFSPTLEGFMRGLLLVGTLLAFAYLLWGAIDWILSQGEQAKIETARKKMTHALIGLGLLASVGAIFLIVQSFLGVSILSTSRNQGPGNPASGGSVNGPSQAELDCLRNPDAVYNRGTGLCSF